MRSEACAGSPSAMQASTAVWRTRPDHASSPCAARKAVVLSSASRALPAASSARASSTQASTASSLPG